MKKINKIVVLLFLTLMSFGCNSQDIKRIDVVFVNPEIETPFRIKCEEFEKFFAKELDSVSIHYDAPIQQFLSELAKLSKADLAKYSLPDTRIKIKLIYEDKTNELCMDRFVISKQNDLYILSESLKTFIYKSITKK
jgi:hypothetical protein